MTTPPCRSTDVASRRDRRLALQAGAGTVAASVGLLLAQLDGVVGIVGHPLMLLGVVLVVHAAALALNLHPHRHRRRR